MTDHILDLSDEPVSLSIRTGLLVLARREKTEITLPIREVAVLIVSHPQVHFTHAVLAELAASGGVFVTCDESRMPVGMLQSLQGNYVQTERIARQLLMKAPARKRLWQQVVRAKLLSQAATLARLHGSDGGLAAMTRRVRSGDAENVEAQAARRYWPLLFGDAEFHRMRIADDQNRLLNYGYAVLRAIIARAVCAAGLHPSIGLHHHNRYNAFTLADDLMEPFRPVVDLAVARLVSTMGRDVPLDREIKTELVGALTRRFVIRGEMRSLFDVASRLASSLCAVLSGDTRQLELPEAEDLARPAASTPGEA